MIWYVQIAAMPDRTEPYAGDVNYAHILQTLKELGYSGPIGLEYKPEADTETGLKRLHEIYPERVIFKQL